MSSNQVNELHSKAMDIAEAAFFARRKGAYDEAKLLSSEAFDCEKNAASLLQDRLEIEPTRSILFKSAACLAFDAEKYKQAEQMVSLGLEGNPPHEIKDELEALRKELQELKAVEDMAVEKQSDILNIHFNDGKAVKPGKIKLNFFAPIMNCFNDLRNAIPSPFYGDELEIVANSSGSFNLFLQPTEKTSVTNDLFEKEYPLENRLSRILTYSNNIVQLRHLKLNEKEIKALKKFLKCVSKYEASIDFHFNALNGKKVNYQIDKPKSESILKAIDNLDYTNESKLIYDGTFVAINLVTKTFKLQSIEQEDLIEGTICESIFQEAKKISFAGYYKIEVLRRESKKAGEDKIKAKSLLTQICENEQPKQSSINSVHDEQ